MAKGYKHEKLWGTTTSSEQIHNIYVVPRLNGSHGTTDGVSVWIAAAAFQDERIMHETLMHEFIHVIERQFSAELKRRNPAHCTRAAIVFGRELTMMWRNLKRMVAPSYLGTPEQRQLG